MSYISIIPRKAKKSKSTSVQESEHISAHPQKNDHSKQKSMQPKRRFTWKDFGRCVALIVWTAAVFVGAELLVAYLMRLILGEQIAQPVWTAVYGAISYTIALLVIILVPHFAFKKYGRISREKLGLKGLPTWTDIGLSIAGIIAYFILAAILTALFTALFSWFQADQVQDVGFNAIYSAGDRIVAFIALVIVAPIAEEILFRGWLYGKLRSTIPGKLSIPIAMLLVSILFGVLHGQWNVGVNVFALSLVLCGLREITGTIYSGILVHMIKNGIAFYLLYIAGMGM